MLKLTQPTQSRALMLATCFGGITVASKMWIAPLAQSASQSSFSSGVKRDAVARAAVPLDRPLLVALHLDAMELLARSAGRRPRTRAGR